MSPIFDWFFQQYENVPTHIVTLEIIAVVLGLASAWFSKMDNILIYPTGILSTAIFVYILCVLWIAGRFSNQRILFFNEYLRVVYLDAKSGCRTLYADNTNQFTRKKNLCFYFCGNADFHFRHL